MASFNIARILIVYFLVAPQLSENHSLIDTVSVEFKKFYDFMVKFGKNYGGVAEQTKRFDIFKTNLKIIDRLNKNINDFAEYGITKFSDLTAEEFKTQVLRPKNDQPTQTSTWTSKLWSSKKDEPPKTSTWTSQILSPKKDEPPKTSTWTSQILSPKKDEPPKTNTWTSQIWSPKKDEPPKSSTWTSQILSPKKDEPPKTNTWTSQILSPKKDEPPKSSTWTSQTLSPKNDPPPKTSTLTSPGILVRLQVRSVPSSPENGERKDFFSWVEGNPYYPDVEDQVVASLCPVFVIVGALSIMYSANEQKKISLSKQQVADCAKFFVNHKPITRDRVYTYVTQHYLATEADYPFIGDDKAHPCNKEVADKGVVRLYDYTRPQTEKDIKLALRHGPIVTSICGSNLQHYISGVITDCPNEMADHAAVIVEHGIETIANGTEVPYYLLRNSWGTDYGYLNGHVKVQRGTCRVGDGVRALKPRIRSPGGKKGCVSNLCKKLKPAY